MKSYKKMGLLVSWLVGSSAQAQQILDPNQTLNFSISREGMTRISIEGDAIEDIYAYPQEYADNIQQHKSGHAFVVAEGMEGPLYVTLITRRGVAQDMKLTPASKKGEPILLKYETEESRLKEREAEAASLLRVFTQGMVPEGFYAVELKETSRTALLRDNRILAAHLKTAYQNARYRVLVYEIHNDTGEPVSLDNRLFWEGKDLASSFDQLTLEEDQSANLYVMRKF